MLRVPVPINFRLILNKQAVMNKLRLRWLRYAVVAVVSAVPCLNGHDIITTNLTYSRDISRIFATHCVACHGAGSSIPLTNYKEARPWAVDIKDQVLSRAMPPWGAVKGFGELAPDHGLSQEDILIVAAWVVGGAPEGNPQMLPKVMPAAQTAVILPLKDAVTIETQSILTTSVRVVGIRPLANAVVPSARLVARLPNGRIEPLLWLFQFDPKSADPRMHGTFTFRRPLDLPRGTVVQSSVPLRFALETEGAKGPSPVS